MPTLVEIINQNKDKFPEGAEGIVQQTIDAAKGLGYSVLANNNKEPEYLPKSRVDEVTASKNDYKKQVDDLNKDLAALKKAAEGNEGLQKQIETLQGEIEKSGKKAKDALAKAAAKVAGAQSKAKDPDDLIRFIDFNKVTVNDDETITGLDEQVKTLAESKPYLFGEEKKPPNGGGSNPAGGGNAPAESNPWKQDTFNLTKQGQLMKTDPAKANKLMKEAGVI